MAEALLSIARDVAREAAELAARRRAEGVQVAATKSTAVDIVTAADREVEALIRDRLSRLRPEDGFAGEESGGASGTSGLTWVVDPIDGTVNYLYGIPQYAVSIAVVEGEADPAEWRPLAGCVLNPATGDEFVASAGGGSRLGDRVLELPSPPPLAEALVATGFAYDAERRRLQGRRLAELLPQLRDIRRFGAASLDLCAVATGQIDAYFETGLWPWDHAAGGLVAEEAGARVTGWAGAAAGSDFIAAGHPALLEELLAALGEEV